MRQFVVVGHTAPTEPDFFLDDLAGGAGRLDVLCRCANAAFVLSHAIRTDVELFLVLRDRLTVRFVGSDLRSLNPDERSTAALIRRALETATEAVGHREIESTPGILVSKRGLETVLDDATGTVIQLHEDGQSVVGLDPPADPVFVLSDHRDFETGESKLLADCADARISLGPEPLHADHAIVVAHNYLDTDGFDAY